MFNSFTSAIDKDDKDERSLSVLPQSASAFLIFCLRQNKICNIWQRSRAAEVIIKKYEVVFFVMLLDFLKFEKKSYNLEFVNLVFEIIYSSA
jgi:hypothetical protein